MQRTTTQRNRTGGSIFALGIVFVILFGAHASVTETAGLQSRASKQDAAVALTDAVQGVLLLVCLNSLA